MKPAARDALFSLLCLVQTQRAQRWAAPRLHEEAPLAKRPKRLPRSVLSPVGTFVQDMLHALVPFVVGQANPC